MQFKKPGEIQFFEEASLQDQKGSKSKLTLFVRKISFGLIKNDTEAGIVVLFFLAAIGVATYFFIKTNETRTPTTHFEILPQESIGSPQGLPQKRI
jgi:hypothetical protein